MSHAYDVAEFNPFGTIVLPREEVNQIRARRRTQTRERFQRSRTVHKANHAKLVDEIRRLASKGIPHSLIHSFTHSLIHSFTLHLQLDMNLHVLD
jgi:predicted N-formylglutamate amidohydrolase